VQVTGSVKYDGASADRNNPRTHQLRELLDVRPTDLIWIAGSTQAPEEEIVLDIYRRARMVHPNLRLLLVPRQKDRFDEVADLLQKTGLPFVRRLTLTTTIVDQKWIERNLPATIIRPPMVAGAIGGAQIFIHAIDDIATRFDVSHLVFALLVAPIATELPEALNSSVIWARRGKDVLALGNITGAMVFQATFPVTIGLLFTPWRLDQPAAVAAAIALLAAGLLYLTASLKGRLRGRLLLVQGIFYIGYVIYVTTRP
jgi:hypothetical protein